MFVNFPENTPTLQPIGIFTLIECEAFWYDGVSGKKKRICKKKSTVYRFPTVSTEIERESAYTLPCHAIECVHNAFACWWCLMFSSHKSIQNSFLYTHAHAHTHFSLLNPLYLKNVIQFSFSLFHINYTTCSSFIMVSFYIIIMIMIIMIKIRKCICAQAQ